MLLNGGTSDLVAVSSGVLQDTVLGPLPFLLYTDDLPLSTPTSSTKLFANDNLLFRPLLAEDDSRLFQLKRQETMGIAVSYTQHNHPPSVFHSVIHIPLSTNLSYNINFNTHINHMTKKPTEHWGP